MKYMHFESRVAQLTLTRDQKTEVEKIFCGVRCLHNHFVTESQHLSNEEAKLAVRTYDEFKADLVSYVGERQQESQHITDIDEHILESHLQIVASCWKDFKSDNRNRPLFKNTKALQSFWITIPEAIDIDAVGITIRGKKPLRLSLPYFESSGRPTTYRISRDVYGTYWFFCLYEKEAEEPDPKELPFVIHGGIMLREFQRKEAKEIRRGDYAAAKVAHEGIAPVRRSIVSRLFKTHPAVKQTSQQEVEYT